MMCLPAAVLAVTFVGAKTEVVVPEAASAVVRFAGAEATNFLSRALGASVPLVTRPTAGRTHLALGAKPEETRDLARDESVIEASGDTVRVYGRDAAGSLGVNAERGTLFGVYRFLEKHVGCRFYFPGELGEIVPRRDRIDVPDGRDASVPRFKVRNWSSESDGIWFEGEDRKNCAALKRLNYFRLSMQSENLQCCHGLGRSHFTERFAKTYPEYFRLDANGERVTTLNTQVPNQLCFSSGVLDVIYADAKEKLLSGRVADLMPQDCMAPCQCEGCKAVYWKDAPGGNWANRQVWDMTARIARRLEKEGVKGVVTQMAYHPYGLVPDIELPDNVRVMVALGGPWSNAAEQERQIAQLKEWRDKIGPKVWTWNYMTKWSTFAMPGIPQVCPRAWADWYARIGDLVFGAYANSSSDRWLYNYLNYYVFSRLALDPTCDWRAVLDEHYRLMFGPAADEMRTFFEDLEDVWLSKVAGRVVTTPLGPMNVPPTDEDLWRRIYTDELFAKWDALLADASRKVGADSLEGRRVALFRREYLDVLKTTAAEYFKRSSAVGAYVHKATERRELRLRPLRSHPNAPLPDAEIRTTVRTWRSDDRLFFVFDCDEPLLDDALTVVRRPDDMKVWKDNGIEMFLNPSADRRTMYQFIVSSRGDWFDCRTTKLGAGKSKEEGEWNSGATCRAVRTAKGWRAEIEIPVAAFPEVKEVFSANFCRNRVVKGLKPAYSCYVWSPFVRQYDDLENYGSVDYRQTPEAVQLIPEREGDFDVEPKGRALGRWIGDGNGGYGLDRTDYLFPPASLRLTSERMQSVTFLLTDGASRLQPGRRYRLSFFIKGENVEPLKPGNGAGITVCDKANRAFPPDRAFLGTFGWQHHVYDFTADAETNVRQASYLRPRITLAKGTVWFDGIRLEELGPGE